MTDPVDVPNGGKRSAALPLPLSIAARQGQASADIGIAGRSDRPRHLAAVPDGVAGAEARDRHPSAAVARRLDTYLAAVADALEAHDVVAGPPQRSDPSSHLVGSIVLDCSAVRSTAGEHGRARSPARWSAMDAFRLGSPVPVLLAWDEDHGWVVGLRLDDVRSSRRLAHPDLLPPSTVVAEFVVGLARMDPLGDDGPARATGSGPRRL
jgi:hypothetical protein